MPLFLRGELAPGSRERLHLLQVSRLCYLVVAIGQRRCHSDKEPLAHVAGQAIDDAHAIRQSRAVRVGGIAAETVERRLPVGIRTALELNSQHSVS